MMNDLEIAKRIAEGDRPVTDQFVRDHYPAVFRLLRHLTRNREDAEDLTQQTLLVARAKIQTYRGTAELKSWLHRIAFNEYAQWKRRRRRFDRLRTESPTFERGFESVIVGESLLTALAALNDRQREAFILHEVEGMPLGEVAKLVRAPVGTVKARLFYARQELRALLTDGPKEINHESEEAIV